MQGSLYPVEIIERALLPDQRQPRVLIVEDEAMVSMLIEDMVCDLGGHVVGPATTFEQGMTLALDAEFELAILDVNLEGLVVYPIADVLRHRSIPFIFTTGYDSSVIPQRYRRYRLLSKPFSPQVFGHALSEHLPGSWAESKM